MTSYERNPSDAYRLPLPVDEPMAPEEALCRLRARRPAQLTGRPGDGAVLDVADADAVVWRPEPETLAALAEPWDFVPWRDAVGDRKFALDVPKDYERHSIQALSEAGFVLQRRNLLLESEPDAAPGRVWLVVKRDDDYRVRLCTEADEEPILRLFAPAFHADRSGEHWRWKYLENPWGRRWISLAETASLGGTRGELAAHYAGYPVPFVRWNDPDDDAPEELMAVQIGDTMTAPEHRQVGLGWTSLLGRAVRHHFARFGREGVAFYYGFNNGKIRNFNLRFIEGRWAGSVGFYRRSLPFEAPESENLRAERFDLQQPPEHDIDHLFHRVGYEYRMLIRRDATWLGWRYGACPDEPPFFAVALWHDESLVGWSVFRKHVDAATGRAQLRWVDALFDREHVSAAGMLVAEALRQPEADGVEQMTAWFSPRPDWWVDALGDLGFERVAEPNDLGLIYLPFDDPKADETFLSVYYTWGDSDLT